MQSANRCFTIGLILAFATTLGAQPDDEHPARAELLADVSAIQPNKPFTLGIRLTMQPGWHVYWINPGDSGEPPHVEWTLPEGFTASELQFPTPKRFDQPGDLVGYGYEDEVVLTATITPPGDLKTGTKVPIEAHVTWLVCEDICIPGEAKLSVELPVSDAPESAHADVFKRWSARMPQSASDRGAQIKQEIDSNNRQLLITIDWNEAAPQNANWFPPPADTLTFSDIRVERAGRQTKITCKFAPLAGRKIPQQTMEAVLAYDAAEGQRRGLVVPFDLQQHRHDILIPVD